MQPVLQKRLVSVVRLAFYRSFKSLILHAIETITNFIIIIIIYNNNNNNSNNDDDDDDDAAAADDDDDDADADADADDDDDADDADDDDDDDDDDEPVKGVEILLCSSLAYGYCVFLEVRPNFRVLSVDEIGCKRSLKAWCLVRRWKNAGKCSSSEPKWWQFSNY